ncbi:MAG: sigma-E processing peptidase SpoIIGA [Clostridia bacterium]|nr:sigma-E processing peptidase SpoIIGA [Clostridia bacterium]
MQGEVYADLYFLVNMGMNLLSLMLAARLLHRPVKRWRAILAAASGGLYAVLALLFGSHGVLGFLADVALAFVMCAITFAERGGRFSRLIKCTAVQFLTSILLGGVMTALYSLLNRLNLPLEALQGDGISVWLFVLLSAAAGLATARGGKFLRRSDVTKSVCVCAKTEGRVLKFTALVDSGNLLCDPISGRGVIVVDRKKLLPALPVALRDALAKDTPTEWMRDARCARMIRLIPAKTATGERLLPALSPDELLLGEGAGASPADYLLAPADLGDAACGFDAIIPLE